MKYIWRGTSSGVTAYARTKQSKDIRLVSGRLVDLPDDDLSLTGWIANQLNNGNLVEQKQ